MRIFIDATSADPDIRVFGMTLLERLLHGIRRSGVEPSEVRVALRGDGDVAAHPARRAVSRRATEPLPVAWEFAKPGSLAAAIAALESDGEDWLVLSADTIVDGRLYKQIADLEGSVGFTAAEGGPRSALLRLGRERAGLADLPGETLLEVVDAMLESGAVRQLGDDELDTYIVSLRRELAPYAFRVCDERARKDGERFLFWSNYKGSTDFMTKYVWPPLVWLMVRPLARWRVHPNAVTAVSIIATFVAIPYAMNGQWATSLFLSYLMSVLDSVDGKLARTTFSYSKLGDILDHGLDIVHPPFWYMGWAWGLGAAQASSGSPAGTAVFELSLWMLALYIVDRLLAAAFKKRTGKSIHGFAPIDERMRTFISRRNVNLPIFTGALLIDWLTGAAQLPVSTLTFYGIVAWQGACLVFHAARLAQCWNVPRHVATATPLK